MSKGGTNLEYAKKCCSNLITVFTFGSVLIGAVICLSAGLFKDQVHHEELNGNIQLSINLKAFLGLILLLYSLAGLSLSCSKRFEEKVRIATSENEVKDATKSNQCNCQIQLIWLLNIALTLIGLSQAYGFEPTETDQTLDIHLDEDS